ncbi:hypothetical protein ACSSS7_006083 [Eimeria intestinalis]
MRTLDQLQQQQQQRRQQQQQQQQQQEGVDDYDMELQEQEEQQQLFTARRQFLKGLQRLDTAFAESQVFLDAHADTLQQALRQQQQALRHKQQQQQQQQQQQTPSSSPRGGMEATAAEEQEAEAAAQASLREIAALYNQVQQEAGPYLNDLTAQTHRPSPPPGNAPGGGRKDAAAASATGAAAAAAATPRDAGSWRGSEGTPKSSSAGPDAAGSLFPGAAAVGTAAAADLVMERPPPPAAAAAAEAAKAREHGLQFFALDADSGPPTPVVGPAAAPPLPPEAQEEGAEAHKSTKEDWLPRT